MSESMSNDPLVAKLIQFNPAASTIDRDAMLFAAGRASAPRSQGWKALAGILACSQAAMIALWFSVTPSGIPSNQPLVPVAPWPVASSSDEATVHALALDSYGNLMHEAASGKLPTPSPAADAVTSGSILSTDSNSLNSLLE
jgi:hypothetical protein